MSTERQALRRFATIIAGLTAPLATWWLHAQGHSWGWSAGLALVFCAAARGALDHGFKHLLGDPALSLDAPLVEREADALQRRRLYFWSRKFRLVIIYLSLATLLWLIHGDTSWTSEVAGIASKIGTLASPAMLKQMVILPVFFLFNFVILMGPMMMMGISQMRGLEPGDADFGVKLDDVRGQAEAKEEIRKVISLWQSGGAFVAAGGKRERGVLFLGGPGTGKTMLAKAIATGFNCPIVLMPGSGFAQTFMGMDAVIVRFMARKARKLAAKWGGQCIVFIDEIDAVGMRRSALGAGGMIQRQMPGGMMGGMGQMGLQSLLVVMDGIDSPPFLRRVLTSKLNSWLDALYFVPPSVKFSGGKTLHLRVPKARPSGAQIFFVGATNVPLESLDPALVRAGRMGRHIYFREPTKRDRVDVFELYLGKITCDDELKTLAAREELARITAGYSPASIEQVCNLALTYAQHDGRAGASRDDVTEAMVTLEMGTALGWGYERPEELRATAIHEAGHAVCSHLYMEGTESTRLSVRRRGRTGGHHQAVEVLERTFKTSDELFNDLVWGLGAYAAELVFYGNNTQGVGGDIQSASYLAGTMVGRWGMAPVLPEGADVQKLERIGKALLAVSLPGDVPLPSDKRRAEALWIGHAFVVAYQTILANRAGVDAVANAVIEQQEIFGNDVVALLNGAGLFRPGIAWRELATYPPVGGAWADEPGLTPGRA